MTAKTDRAYTIEKYARQIKRLTIARRKAAAKRNLLFLLQKRSKKESDINEFLPQKEPDNPKKNWFLFKRHSRKQSRLPSQKSQLYDHSKYLSKSSGTQQNYLTTNDDNDDFFYRARFTIMYENE